MDTTGLHEIVRELSDRLALRRLVDLYARFVDGPDPDAFAGLFVPDGGLSSKLPDGSHWGLRGSALKTDLILFQTPRPFEETFHFVANHVCDVESDRATGQTYCLAHHLLHGRAQVQISHIVYDDIYTRTDVGWRFVSRHPRLLWSELRTASMVIPQELIDQGLPRSQAPPEP
jgi:hypothetical protein